MRIEVIGSYTFGQDPWRLVEVVIHDGRKDFDFGEITLPVPGEPSENWQTAWDEKVLSVEDAAAGNYTIHACFFLYRTSEGPIRTPVGDIHLPAEAPVPAHLQAIEFESPD